MYSHGQTTNELPPINPYETWSSAVWRRVCVFVVGVCVGVIASVFYLRATQGMWDFELLTWVVSGPLAATRRDVQDVWLLGWMGALMAFVHPIRPTSVAALVTIVGIALWFLSGFYALAAGHMI
jgi:hypothetical protein